MHGKIKTTAILIVVAASAVAMMAPTARAETGELLAFGEYGNGSEQFNAAGPVAVDPTEDDFFVADATSSAPLTFPYAPRIRKFASDGTLEGAVNPPVANPGGAELFVAALAIDPSSDRLYALLDADDDGFAEAREILVYSTTPEACGSPSCALVPPSGVSAEADGVDDGVLIDFRDGASAGAAVENATGIAVDPGTGKVVLLGVDDTAAADPNGVLQYIGKDGAPSVRITDLGAGDPDGITYGDPAGLGVAPDGTVYFATSEPHGQVGETFSDGYLFRLSRETGVSALFAHLHDTTPAPQIQQPFELAGGDFSGGSSVAVSSDGKTVYLAQGNGGGAVARGYDTATGLPRIAYGGGSSSCLVPNQNFAVGLAAGAGDDLVTTSFNATGASGTALHLFGEGGTGCPRPKFTVNGIAEPAVTVTKGRFVVFDATGSPLLGSEPTELDWDLEGNGTFETHVLPVPPDTAPLFSTTHKFTSTGTFKVGLKVLSEGAMPSEPVYRTVTVVGVTPKAAFNASTGTPAAGESVSFDASTSSDSSASPTSDLANYKWDFGDGQIQETAAPTTSHTFSNSAATPLPRTVKLIVVSHDGVSSAPVSQVITVGPGSSGDSGSNTGGGGSAQGEPTSGVSSPAPGAAPVPKPTHATKCKKGRVKRHGRCVKTKKKQAKPKPKRHGS